MGLALECIAAHVTLANTGDYEELAPGSGSTFTVRNAIEGSAIQLEEVWALDNAHKALVSIKSPNFHDQVHGLLLAIPSGAEAGRDPQEPEVLFPGPETLPLQASDTFSVEAIGTAADVVLAAMLVRYDNLRGADAQYLDWATVQSRLKTVVGIEVDLVTGAGDWGAQATLDSVDPRLKAGKDYAVLGILSDTPVHAIGFTGPNTANYRLGMPGKTDPVSGGDYFVRLAQKYNTPHIPLISGTDKGNYLLDTIDTPGGTAVKATVILAQLS